MISIIVCTHNPDKALLERVLAALANQTLATDHWELILVDSASTNAVPSQIDLSCFKSSQLVQMGKPGLAAARAAGGEAARGELLVFVDDDNVLAPDYLERCEELACRYPEIGVFSASIEAEFEASPSLDMEPYLPYLAVRPLDRDYWSNLPAPHVWPIGAGMALRREVMSRYTQQLKRDAWRRNLGRVGQSLEASEDTDIGGAAFDLKMGCGAFQALKLTHVIRKHRLNRAYLHNLVRSVSRSATRFQTMFAGREVGVNDLAKLVFHFLKALQENEKPEARGAQLSALRGRAEALWQLWTQKV